MILSLQLGRDANTSSISKACSISPMIWETSSCVNPNFPGSLVFNINALRPSG